MKLFCKLSSYILMLVGVALLGLPVEWFPAFYDVRYMGVAAVVSGLVIFMVPILLRVPLNHPQAVRKNYSVDIFQFFLAIAVVNNAFGDLGLYQLYKIGFEYDKIIHFSNSFLAALIVPFVLEQRFEKSKNYAISMAFTAVVICGVLWEIFEFTADQVLGTRIYGINGVNINADTSFDLLFDTFGAVSGAILAYITPLSKRGVSLQHSAIQEQEVSQA